MKVSSATVLDRQGPSRPADSSVEPVAAILPPELLPRVGPSDIWVSPSPGLGTNPANGGTNSTSMVGPQGGAQDDSNETNGTEGPATAGPRSGAGEVEVDPETGWVKPRTQLYSDFDVLTPKRRRKFAQQLHALDVAIRESVARGQFPTSLSYSRDRGFKITQTSNASPQRAGDEAPMSTPEQILAHLVFGRYVDEHLSPDPESLDPTTARDVSGAIAFWLNALKEAGVELDPKDAAFLDERHTSYFHQWVMNRLDGG